MKKTWNVTLYTGRFDAEKFFQFIIDFGVCNTTISMGNIGVNFWCIDEEREIFLVSLDKLDEKKTLIKNVDRKTFITLIGMSFKDEDFVAVEELLESL